MSAADDWTIPPNPARTLLREGGLRVFPLKTRSEFAKFCRDRDLNLSVERLLDLEKLGMIMPIARLCPPVHVGPLRLPLSAHSQWFRRGWAIDTFALHGTEDHSLIEADCESYYSVFQLFQAELVVSLTMSVQMESYLLPRRQSYGPHWPMERRIRKWAEGTVRSLRTGDYRPAVAWLCQFISDRYGPHARSDKRTIQVPQGGFGSWSRFISHRDDNWDWYSISRAWKPQAVAKRFGITREMLKHAYEGTAVTATHYDPIDAWYDLIQFVSVRERDRLGGAALRAESARAMLTIIGKFYEDLYGEKLRHPHEVSRTVITHFPELEVREDPREHLEYVVNRFGLNPRPSVALFVEGESEQVVIHEVFAKYFGSHPGKYFIEIINLKGVNTATGGKRDRFRAILRLVDYLHHHQTICFLILDNENHASRLKEEARRAVSTHTGVRTVMRPERIKIWRRSFEFDNFNDTEIASALSSVAGKPLLFTREQIAVCRCDLRTGDPIARLFSASSGRGLNKPELARLLINRMLESGCRRNPKGRPIIQVLNRVANLAVRNPPPTLKSSWEKNQASRFIGKKRSAGLA